MMIILNHKIFWIRIINLHFCLRPTRTVCKKMWFLKNLNQVMMQIRKRDLNLQWTLLKIKSSSKVRDKNIKMKFPRESSRTLKLMIPVTLCLKRNLFQLKIFWKLWNRILFQAIISRSRVNQLVVLLTLRGSKNLKKMKIFSITLCKVMVKLEVQEWLLQKKKSLDLEANRTVVNLDLTQLTKFLQSNQMLF